MTDILVEKNPSHIDEVQMTAILNDLRDLGYPSEAMEQSTILKAAWWVLVIHWVGGDLLHFGFDSTLTVLGQRVWKRYREQGKTGPKRIDVVDVDDNTIASHEIEYDDVGDDDS